MGASVCVDEEMSGRASVVDHPIDSDRLGPGFGGVVSGAFHSVGRCCPAVHIPSTTTQLRPTLFVPDPITHFRSLVNRRPCAQDKPLRALGLCILKRGARLSSSSQPRRVPSHLARAGRKGRWYADQSGTKHSEFERTGPSRSGPAADHVCTIPIHRITVRR
jgi:hypothetical protein